MAAEDRRQERSALRTDQAVLLCHISLAGDHIPISTIFDVSHAGAGIGVPSALPPGALVDLRYQGQGGAEVVVSGRVAWCIPTCPSNDQAADPVRLAGFRGGICFADAQGGSGEMLISALRPHLDLTALCV